MREIQLTQGKVAQVDDGDYEWLNQWKWSAQESSRKDGIHFYATSKMGTGKPHYMHRVILNAPDGILVDHYDNDGLNNQRNNIRLATNSQNVTNSVKGTRRSSKYKGVSWNARDKIWQSHICLNGHPKNLGNYKAERDAAEVYNVWAIECFGEFAKLNVLEG
jgi:hypothetical protein